MVAGCRARTEQSWTHGRLLPRSAGRSRSGRFGRVASSGFPQQQARADAGAGLSVSRTAAYFAFGTEPSVVMWILISSLTIGT